MSRIRSTWRLGVPVVSCDECDRTLHREEAFMVVVANGTVPMGLKRGTDLCSIACVEITAVGREEPLVAYHWNKALEGYVEIGSMKASGRWIWSPTGNAFWIEENAARLRAAGEIA